MAFSGKQAFSRMGAETLVLGKGWAKKGHSLGVVCLVSVFGRKE
jgi:hypothetical protein